MELEHQNYQRLYNLLYGREHITDDHRPHTEPLLRLFLRTRRDSHTHEVYRVLNQLLGTRPVSAEFWNGSMSAQDRRDNCAHLFQMLENELAKDGSIKPQEPPRPGRGWVMNPDVPEGSWEGAW